MTAGALVVVVLYLSVAFGLRSWIQYRKTGSTGFKGLRAGAPVVERLGAVLFVLAVGGGVLAPVVDLLGSVELLDGLDHLAVRVSGLILALLGGGLTFAAQQQMGDSWRIGVDPAEETSLVAGGLFDVVRNPIFSAMLIAAFGFALAVPNWIALVSLVALVVAVEIQVRAVEEPYLLLRHQADYRRYGSEVGRFLPKIGRW